jgi:uncharacterized protein DUF1918
MKASVGDRIVVESKKVGHQPRAGLVEEVLQEDPLRLRVLWEDGHTSVLAPSAGAAQISTTKSRRRAPQQSRAKPPATRAKKK